jgi:hypothetical protein
MDEEKELKNRSKQTNKETKQGEENVDQWKDSPTHKHKKVRTSEESNVETDWQR